MIHGLIQMLQVWSEGKFIHGPFIMHGVKVGARLYSWDPSGSGWQWGASSNRVLMVKFENGMDYNTHVTDGLVCIEFICSDQEVVQSQGSEVSVASVSVAFLRQQNNLIVSKFRALSELYKIQTSFGVKLAVLGDVMLNNMDLSLIGNDELMASGDQFQWTNQEAETSFTLQIRPAGQCLEWTL